MINHTVSWRLNDGVDEPWFNQQFQKLAGIDGVRHLEITRQLSAKCPFTWSASMWFETAETFAAYEHHPDHVAYVEGTWLPHVAEFMEQDFERPAPWLR